MTTLRSAPGILRLVRGTPNPNGACQAQLFLFVGDPTNAPIEEVIPDEGVTLPAPPSGLAEHPFRLCILHFNDLHGHVSRITPSGDDPVFSRMVWRVRELRQMRRDDPHSAVLFLSGGDDLVGAVFDELLGDDPDSYAVHAGYRLYSAAGVDAGVLGNHDFDRGTCLLAHAIEQDAVFPLLSANLVAPPPLADRVYPAALLTVGRPGAGAGRIRIGIVGLTTPGGIRQGSGPEFRITNPVQVAQNLLPAVRPLCDVLIVLSHLGHSLAASDRTVGTMRDAGDVELAESLPRGSVQLIVGGHTHQILNEGGLKVANIINGIPIVQAGMLGRLMGEVDITIGRGAAVTNVRLTPTNSLPVDETFEREAVQPLLEQVRPIFAQSLGQVAEHPDLSTYAVRNNFAAGESALANFISDAMVVGCRAAGHPVDIAAIDSSSIACGLPRPLARVTGSNLTFGDWFNLMPFADTIRLCRLTGQQFRALLEDNAQRADRPGEPHTERGFLQFSQQVRYTIELGDSGSGSRPPGSLRASHIRVAGRPLDEQLERSFLVACSSFVREAATAWEGYAVRRLCMPVVRTLGPTADTLSVSHIETDLFLRDLMIAHIREHGGVTEEAGVRRDGRLTIVVNDESRTAK